MIKIYNFLKIFRGYFHRFCSFCGIAFNIFFFLCNSINLFFFCRLNWFSKSRNFLENTSYSWIFDPLFDFSCLRLWISFLFKLIFSFFKDLLSNSREFLYWLWITFKIFLCVYLSSFLSEIKYLLLLSNSSFKVYSFISVLFLYVR